MFISQIKDLIVRAKNCLLNALVKATGPLKKVANTIANHAKNKRKDQTKDLKDELMALDDESMDEVAEMHMAVTKYVHTIEIMRWHGLINLDGMYAKESLENIAKKLTENWLAKDIIWKQNIKQWYPPPDKLLKVKGKAAKVRME